MKNPTPPPTLPKDRLILWIKLVLEATDLAWQEKIIDTLTAENFNKLDLAEKLGAIADATGPRSMEISTVTRIVGIAIGSRPRASSVAVAGYLTYRDSRHFPAIQKIAAAIDCCAELSPDDKHTIEIRKANRLNCREITDQKGT